MNKSVFVSNVLQEYPSLFTTEGLEAIWNYYEMHETCTGFKWPTPADVGAIWEEFSSMEEARENYEVPPGLELDDYTDMGVLESGRVVVMRF